MTTNLCKIVDRPVVLNQVYQESNPTAGLITVEGRKELQTFVSQNNLPFPLMSYNEDMYEDEADPNSFESCLWCWKVTGNGEFVGTFPKRYGKWLYNEHGINLTSEQRHQIGNICRQYVEEQEQLFFDFTRDFLWDDGDFGDNDSCFWNTGDDDDDKLKQLVGWGFLAHRQFLSSIRSEKYYPTFDKAEWYKYVHGNARCWLATDSIAGVPEGSVVIFNGYAKRGNLPLLMLARGLSNFLDLPYKRVVLLANDSRDDVLWINTLPLAGGYSPTGYLIAPIETLETFNDNTGTVNFQLEV